MRVFIFGDSNVDVTVKWKDLDAHLDELSPKNHAVISSNIARSNETGKDIEYYLPNQDHELHTFFNSLKPKVEFGGCGAIKARTMAKLGHDVVLYSWVGDDKNGRMLLKELKQAGVDTSHVLVSGRTCETYNLFETNRPRLAFSYWENKLKLSNFVKDIKKEKPDKVFLAGAHRITSGLGYAKIPNAYVFTGSFSPYTHTELAEKYAEDFSKGIIVSNEVEIMQLSGEQDYLRGIKSLKNKYILMHGPDEMIVKRGDELIREGTIPIDKSKVVELTGIGDTWESFFLASVGDIKKASKKDIVQSMRLANKASVYRMMTGEFPTLDKV